MAFVLDEHRIRSARDPESGATMVINSGPQIEYYSVEFSSPTVVLDLEIVIRHKFIDRPIIPKDSANPSVMVSAGYLNFALRKRKLFDFNNNTTLVRFIINMIAFINKKYPLSVSPFLWSDYDDLVGKLSFLYQMPSDDELLKISL